MDGQAGGDFKIFNPSKNRNILLKKTYIKHV